MVLAGRELHSDFPNAHFTTHEEDLPMAEYLIAGAIFNIKLDTPYKEWQKLVVKTLRRMDALCSRGFSFNMLTKYSYLEQVAQRPDLFYGDPLLLFDFC